MEPETKPEEKIEEVVVDVVVESPYIDYSQKSLMAKREFNTPEKSMENDIIRKVMKDRFYSEMKPYNFNFEVISSGKRNKNESFHVFNLFLKNMYEEHRVFMTDMVLFMEEDLFEIKPVLQCLNEENTLILREELSIKYKRKKSKLELLLEDE
jgi:hypothetical protein